MSFTTAWVRVFVLNVAADLPQRKQINRAINLRWTERFRPGE